MALKKLRDYLDDNDVKYITIIHSRTVTAQEIAESAHIPGKELAKTVMVKTGDKIAMAVLPSVRQIDFDALRDALGRSDISLASESEFSHLFPGCETGAMPPFGNLYDVDVYVASDLAEDEKISFNAGSHTELVQLAFSDYKRLVKPAVIHF